MDIIGEEKGGIKVGLQATVAESARTERRLDSTDGIERSVLTSEHPVSLITAARGFEEIRMFAAVRGGCAREFERRRRRHAAGAGAGHTRACGVQAEERQYGGIQTRHVAMLCLYR